MLLIAVALLLEFSQLEVGAIDLLLKRVAMVGLLGDISLGCENFSLTSVDLLPCCGDFPLQVVVVAVLFVKQESGVVDLLSQHVKRCGVGVVALFEVVVLKELFVLEVAVLRLDRVELVSQRQVVFVALLDLEDFSL